MRNNNTATGLVRTYAVMCDSTWHAVLQGPILVRSKGLSSDACDRLPLWRLPTPGLLRNLQGPLLWRSYSISLRWEMHE